MDRRQFLKLAAVAAIVGPRVMPLERMGGSKGLAFATSGPYDPTLAVGATVLTQIHCHTTASDGDYSAAAVVADYVSKGYGALALTDHDLVTSQPGGITSAISGNELSPSGHHIVSINSNYTRGATTDAQQLIDGIRAAGGEASIAHPLWASGLSQAQMAALTNYRGMEIHNAKVVSGAGGHDPVTYPGYAIARWDALLASRRDIWAFAVDDLHFIDAYNTYDIGRLHVFAESNSVANVMSRITSGNFVADVSNYGVTPGFPGRTGGMLSLTCPGAVSMEAWAASGRIATVAGSSIAIAPTVANSYIRFVAVGDYTEPFDSLSDRWLAVDGAWAANGTLALSSDDTIRRIVLRRQREGDFTVTLDARVVNLGVDNAALMFNVLDSNHYYMVRFGDSGAPAYDGKLTIAKTTDGTFGDPLDSAAFAHVAGTWYSLRLSYTAATGTIQARIWARGSTEPGTWDVEATDTTWTHGAFGFRASRAAEFDNLYISGFRTYYQPIAVDAA